MTRAELEALFTDILGLRINPVEIETLLLAVDRYAIAQQRQVIEDIWKEIHASSG